LRWIEALGSREAVTLRRLRCFVRLLLLPSSHELVKRLFLTLVLF